MIAAAWLAAFLVAAPARATDEPAVCPEGTHHVSTDNPYEPFKCVTTAEETNKGFDSVVGPQGFATRPRCPHGTRPVREAGNSLQPYRCVRASADAPDPELAPVGPPGDATAAPAESDPLTQGCPQGQHKVRTTDPIKPYHCVPLPTRTLGAGAYGRYSIPRAIAFDYPASFRVQDAWKEDVPTLYLKLDDNSAGKPVTITVTRYVESQSTYEEMSEAIARDVEWQGAKDVGTLTLPGLGRARVTSVPGDTRSVYLPINKQSYYSFVYSAPADSFETYLPAFSRLLKSLKLGGAVR